MNSKPTLISSLIHWLGLLIKELRNHITTLIIILILYFLLWKFPQTKDLLIILTQASQYHIPNIFLFFISIAVLAFIVSNAHTYFYGAKSLKPRDRVEEQLQVQKNHRTQNAKTKPDSQISNNVLTNQIVKQVRTKETESAYIKRVLPKVLATILIVVIAFSLSNLNASMRDGISEGWFNFSFAILLILLLLATNQNFKSRFIAFFDRHFITDQLPLFIALFCVCGILLFGLFNRGGSVNDTLRLFFALNLLAVLFFTLSVSYSKSIIWFKEKIGVYLIFILIIFAFGAYIYFFFCSHRTQGINPINIILISAIAIFSLITLINFVGSNSYKIPLLPIVLSVLVMWGIYTGSRDDFNYYEVSSVKTSKDPDKRPPIDQHIRSWIQDRIGDIEASDSFPVIFVASEGGGSRAGLWSSLVHSKLYNLNPDYFNLYLFSMAGASGGSVGNTFFYNEAYAHFKANDTARLLSSKPNGIFTFKASEFYEGNFLSSSIAALFGKDPFTSITGISGNSTSDRGKNLELEWERAFDQVFNTDKNLNSLGESYLSLVPDTTSVRTPPILITSTTHLQSGSHSIISPVKLNIPNVQTKLYRDFLDDYKRAYPTIKEHKNKHRSIKISTAMLLSARFPFVSPVGRVKNIGQFADAGYYDNSGSTITNRLIHTFENILQKEFSDIAHKVETRILFIGNDPDPLKKNALVQNKIPLPIALSY